MKLSDALQKISAKRLCILAKWLETQPGVADDLNAAAETESAHKLWRALKLIGYAGGQESARKHIAKDCLCYRNE